MVQQSEQKPDPRPGDTWICNNHSSATGREVRVTEVTPTFGRNSRIYYYMIDGLGGSMNSSNFIWCMDFKYRG